MDDDSSPGLGVFYIDFNTNVPWANFRGAVRERDWSMYNANFIGTDNPAWSHGNFMNGFPRFILDLLRQEYGTPTHTWRYFFRYPTQGFNASDPNDDYLFIPNTSVGNTASNFFNANTFGAFGRGHTRILGQEGDFLELDSDGLVGVPDCDIIHIGGTNTFTFPRFITGSPANTINHAALRKSQYGRELRFINKGAGYLTLSPSGTGGNLFIDSGWTDVTSVGVSYGETVTLKIISKNSIPSHVSEWRWCVVERTWN